MPQQVLGFEVHQVQIAEQAEQRRGVVGAAFPTCFALLQRAKFQCDRIFDAVVFAAVIRVSCRHGEPMAAVVVEELFSFSRARLQRRMALLQIMNRI
ncbi:hypothetical protein D3C76_1441180 [compost metagenome]